MALQSFDGAQGGEESFADGLQLVVIQRQEAEVLQVLEGVDPQAVYFVGIQQSETKGVYICNSDALLCWRKKIKM